MSADLRAALDAGWRDFRRAPGYGVFFSLVYVLGGWLIVAAMALQGQVWWTIPAMAGFPILGPFIACGFYEISRPAGGGRGPGDTRTSWGRSGGRRTGRSPRLAAVIVVFFLFWNFLSHIIFALFLGRATLTNISTSIEVFLTPAGLAMLAFGAAVGAVLAVLLFALTVVSLPLLAGPRGGFHHGDAVFAALCDGQPCGDAGLGRADRTGAGGGYGAGLSGPVSGAAAVGPCKLAPVPSGDRLRADGKCGMSCTGSQSTASHSRWNVLPDWPCFHEDFSSPNGGVRSGPRSAPRPGQGPQPGRMPAKRRLRWPADGWPNCRAGRSRGDRASLRSIGGAQDQPHQRHGHQARSAGYGIVDARSRAPCSSSPAYSITAAVKRGDNSRPGQGRRPASRAPRERRNSPVVAAKDKSR